MSKGLHLIPTPAGPRVSVCFIDRLAEVVKRYGLVYLGHTRTGYRRLSAYERPREGDLTYCFGSVVREEWEEVDRDGEEATRYWAENNLEIYVRLWHMTTIRRIA